MFTLEYSYWFDYMLPGPRPAVAADPARRHLQPLPRRPAARARRVGPVQRDRGRRPRPARRRRRATRSASSTRRPTRRPARRSAPWIRQRTRWIKGYMQTALVHSRRPVKFTREAGLRGLAGFLLLIAGTPATFLATPILWLLTAVWISGAASGGGRVTPLPASVRHARRAQPRRRQPEHDRPERARRPAAADVPSAAVRAARPALLGAALDRRLASARAAHPAARSCGRRRRTACRARSRPRRPWTRSRRRRRP